ncbi:MAG TPA: MaoC/PaaZ C-terminal domain-containing protein [Sphingomonadales bacterium]|nr:MaoC/PaaZ C-terminal domain-containing protein [Sphingomonadales bacterium]
MNKPTPPGKRFYEDFAPGQRFVTAALTVTREMITRFAAEYDPQAIHLDEEAAKKSMFGELIGSGWQTGALSMRLVAEAKPFGAAPVVGLEVHAMKFLKPMKPNMRLHVTGEILEGWRSRSKPLGFFKVALVTHAEGAGPIMTQTWTVVLPLREGA